MASSFADRISSALSALGKRKEPSEVEDASSGSALTPRAIIEAPKRPPKKSNFEPWSQAALHRRLATYRPLTWFSKPPSVGPVPCASRGWVNEARDTLCCEYCSTRLIYPANVPFDVTAVAAEAFKAQLVSSHEKMCPWRASACSEALVAFNEKSAVPAQLAQAYEKRVAALTNIDLLPALDPRALEEMQAPPFEAAVRQLLSDTYGGPTSAVPTAGHPAMSMSATAAGDTPAGSPSMAMGSSTPMRLATGGRTRSAVLPPTSLGGVTPGAGSLTTVTATTAAAARVSGGGGNIAKLSAAQRASLLALLGWEVQVVASESSETVTALQNAASYGLSHLLGGGGGASKRARKDAGSSAGPIPAAAPGSTTGSSTKTSCLNVVLHCPHCQARVGLWNYAGLRPSVVGHFHASSHSIPASSPAPVASPSLAIAAAIPLPSGDGDGAAHAGMQVYGGASDGTVNALDMLSKLPSPMSTPGGGEKLLSRTIAGGGFSTTTRSRAAAAAAASPAPPPFRFGSAAASAPVFGLAALASPPSNRQQPAAAAATAAAPGQAESQMHGALGMKAPATPAAPGNAPATTTPAPSLAGAGVTARAASLTSVSATQTEFDLLHHHRPWCPWVYTGPVATETANSSSSPSARPRHRSGWQVALDAIVNPPSVDASASAVETAGVTPRNLSSQSPGAAITAGSNAGDGRSNGAGGSGIHEKKTPSAKDVKDRLLGVLRARQSHRHE